MNVFDYLILLSKTLAVLTVIIGWYFITKYEIYHKNSTLWIAIISITGGALVWIIMR